MLIFACNQNSAMPTCPFCQADKGVLQYHTTDIYGSDFDILRCSACHSFYLSPQPTADYLNEAYSSSYYGEGEQKFKGFIQKGIHYFIARRARRLNQMIGPDAKVLDIGCGSGYFLKSMLDTGSIEAHGIELPGKSAERASKVPGINLKIGKLEKGDFPTESLDMVTMFHVFEHLDQPAQTLETISKILKKGGYLYLSCPNVASWQSRLFKGNWFHLDPPRHLFLMPPAAIKEHLEKLGFTTVKEKYFNPKYNPYGYQQSLLNRTRLKRDLLFEHLKGNTTYANGTSKASLFLQSASFKLSFPLFLLADLTASAFKRSATVEFIFKKV